MEERKAKGRAASKFMDGATDWSLSVDLNRRLKVPVRIAKTNLRPDICCCRRKIEEFGLRSSRYQVRSRLSSQES